MKINTQEGHFGATETEWAGIAGPKFRAFPSHDRRIGKHCLALEQWRYLAAYFSMLVTETMSGYLVLHCLKKVMKRANLICRLAFQ